MFMNSTECNIQNYKIAFLPMKNFFFRVYFKIK